MIVFGRQYHQAEKVLIPVSFLLMIAIVSSTFVFHVNFGSFVSLGLSPLQPYGNPSFAYLLAASVGAVIMPWMLYFHSGADSRRHKEVKDLKNERLETLIGAVVSEILMIILGCGWVKRFQRRQTDQRQRVNQSFACIWQLR